MSVREIAIIAAIASVLGAGMAADMGWSGTALALIAIAVLATAIAHTGNEP